MCDEEILDDQIAFMPGEAEQLGNALRKAAEGIAAAWDVLTKVGERIGRDWEPSVNPAVRDIADILAADLQHPSNAAAIKDEDVAKYFSDVKDWPNRA
jgi:hypothetical protein